MFLSERCTSSSFHFGVWSIVSWPFECRFFIILCLRRLQNGCHSNEQLEMDVEKSEAEPASTKKDVSDLPKAEEIDYDEKTKDGEVAVKIICLGDSAVGKSK